MDGANIYIFGPGGIGKMSTARHLAGNLGYLYINLNQIFNEKHGLQIDEYINTYGQDKYYKANSTLFRKLLARNPRNTVWGLSYGFLVYEDAPELAREHIEFTKPGIKFLILPFGSIDDSFDYVTLKRSQSTLSQYEEEKEQFAGRAKNYMDLVDHVIYSLGSPRRATNLITEALRN